MSRESYEELSVGQKEELLQWILNIPCEKCGDTNATKILPFTTVEVCADCYANLNKSVFKTVRANLNLVGTNVNIYADAESRSKFEGCAKVKQVIEVKENFATCLVHFRGERKAVERQICLGEKYECAIS